MPQDRPTDQQITVPREGAAGRAPAAPAVPELLMGRYRVLSEDRTGGFGVVCACWDTILQRRVAIKRLPLSGADGSSADEALREARTACMLGRPNIVAVHDFHHDDAFAYIVMEYVDGLNLAELLSRVEGGRLTGDECAHLLSQVASALRFAHENRVLHLDIKPTNILVDRSGTVKLADFGMASLASAAGYGGARGGTVGYMPPEQVQGLMVDERADVFTLAAVTWQALSGRAPFAAPTAAASLDLIRRGPSRRLVRDCPDLPARVQDVLLAALAPEAAGRPSSVDGLADELVPLLGSPEEGRESLSDLVGQASADDGADRPWRPGRLPLSALHPWAAPLAERAASALCTLGALAATLPHVPDAAPHAMAVSLVAAGATALLPPLGAPLAVMALCWALLAVRPTPASFPVAFAVGAAVAPWWLRAGRRGRTGSAALLAPCCLPCPGSAALLAAYGMRPLAATATAAGGFALGTLFRACAEEGFSATPALARLFEAWAGAGTWAALLGACAGALLGAALTRRGSVRPGLAGQAVALAGVVGGAVAGTVVENGGISAAPIGAFAVIAVLLFVFLCIATVLRGPLPKDHEGEE